MPLDFKDLQDPNSDRDDSPGPIGRFPASEPRRITPIIMVLVIAALAGIGFLVYRYGVSKGKWGQKTAEVKPPPPPQPTASAEPPATEPAPATQPKETSPPAAGKDQAISKVSEGRYTIY